MRQWKMLIASSLIVFSGCNGAKKPNAANLKSAIDQYLPTQNRACVTLDGEFPHDMLVGDKSNMATELSALEQVGLVQSVIATAVVRSLANSLSLSPQKPVPVKRYTVSAEGQKYFQKVLDVSGRLDGFCYGHEKVASIVNWTEPETQGSYTETTVTYTGIIPDLAAWAKLPGVQQSFPSIQTTLNAVRQNQTVALHLTNKGWVVSGS